MTAVVTVVDLSTTEDASAKIVTAIDALSPDSSDIVNSIVIGKQLYVWKYPL